MERVVYYRNKRVDDMTREELLEAFNDVAIQHIQDQHRHEQNLKTLSEIHALGRRYR